MCQKTELNYVLDSLSKILTGKSVILGIGNTLRQDDGFGSSLAQALTGKISLKVWDAGISPENFLGAIKKEHPSEVLLVDAVDFGVDTAQIRLFDSEEVKTKNFFTTHDTSLALIFDFLEKEASAKLFLLAVQPKSIGFGEGMSLSVEKCLMELKGWFLGEFAL